MKTVKEMKAMNNMTHSIRTLGAAILCAATLAACSGDDSVLDGSAVETPTLFGRIANPAELINYGNSFQLL